MGVYVGMTPEQSEHCRSLSDTAGNLRAYVLAVLSEALCRSKTSARADRSVLSIGSFINIVISDKVISKTSNIVFVVYSNT